MTEFGTKKDMINMMRKNHLRKSILVEKVEWNDGPKKDLVGHTKAKIAYE